MPELIDYEAVLGDLEAKRAALDAAIAGIRQMLNLGAQNGLGNTSSGRTGEPLEIQSDTFFGLSIGEGAKKLLKMTKRKMTAAAIAEFLERGGFQHTSKFFPNTVRTALMRLAVDGEVVQVGKEWGLTEWYPGRKKGKAVSVKPSEVVATAENPNE